MGKMVAAVEEMLQSVGWSAQGLQLTMHELVVVLVVVQLVRTLHRFRPFVIVMLQGLVYCPPPTTESLRVFSPSQQAKGKAANPREDFTIPRDAPIVLESKQLDDKDIASLRMADEFDTMALMAAISLTCLAVTEAKIFLGFTVAAFSGAFFAVLPTLFCALFNLISVLRTYSADEYALCGVAAVGLLLVTIGGLVSDSVFDFELTKATQAIDSALADYFDHPEDAPGMMPEVRFLKVVLSLSTVLPSILLAYPGYRFAYSHLAALELSQESLLFRLLLNVNFFMPLFISLSFSPLLYSEALDLENQTTANTFVNLRAHFVFLYCVLQVLLLRTYLQSFFNLAHDRIAALPSAGVSVPAAQKKRVKASFVQTQILAIVRYGAVVAVQLFSFPVLLFSSWFLMWSKGGLGWVSELAPPAAAISMPQAATIIPPVAYRSVGSFMCWWLATAWMCLTATWLLFIRSTRKQKAS
eukprot:m.133857 g.133857  ORF g.133857 m.133857 type:complete len:470 (-) comp16897_c1_seq4:419-1828(-)